MIEERLPAAFHSALTVLNFKGNILPQKPGLPRWLLPSREGVKSLVHYMVVLVLLVAWLQRDLRGKQKCYSVSLFCFSSSLCYECDFRAKWLWNSFWENHANTFTFYALQNVPDTCMIRLILWYCNSKPLKEKSNSSYKRNGWIHI